MSEELTGEKLKAAAVTNLNIAMKDAMVNLNTSRVSFPTGHNIAANVNIEDSLKTLGVNPESESFKVEDSAYSMSFTDAQKLAKAGVQSKVLSALFPKEKEKSQQPNTSVSQVTNTTQEKNGKLATKEETEAMYR